MTSMNSRYHCVLPLADSRDLLKIRVRIDTSSLFSKSRVFRGSGSLFLLAAGLSVFSVGSARGTNMEQAEMTILINMRCQKVECGNLQILRVLWGTL